MNIQIDNISVFRVSACLFILMSGVTWLMLGRPRKGAPLVWSLGGGLVGVAATLLSLRGQLSDNWGYVAPQTLYLASFLLLAQSLRMDLKRPWRWHRLLAVLTVYAAILVWVFPDKRSQDMALFVRVVNLAGLAILTQTTVALARQERSRKVWFMTVGYAIMTTSMALAVVGTAMGRATLHNMNQGLFNQLLSWASLLSMLSSYLGYLGLVLERSLRENMALHQAQWQEQQWRERSHELSLRDRQHALEMLANSLGHSIVQPLTATQLHVQMTRRLLLTGSADPAMVTQMLDQAQEGIHRAVAMVERIRTFLRPANTQAQAVVLQSVVRQAQSLLHQEMKYRHVEFQVALPEPGLHVMADELTLTQALVQLLRNAMQAIQTSDSKTISVCVARNDSEGWIEVVDSGPGFSPEMLSRSGGGRQTVVDEFGGLGLYMTQELLGQWGGRLVLSNTPSSGAMACMVLPLV